jgi:hypothetical protein
MPGGMDRLIQIASAMMPTASLPMSDGIVDGQHRLIAGQEKEAIHRAAEANEKARELVAISLFSRRTLPGKFFQIL